MAGDAEFSAKARTQLVGAFNALGDLTEAIWKSSTAKVGLTTDPRMVSIQLFRRASGHTRAFSLLWGHELIDDSAMMARAMAEVAICVANLKARPLEFVAELKSDAARTVSGQIPIWYQDEAERQKAQAEMRTTFGAYGNNGGRHQSFDWKTLAAQADVTELYDWHKHLSGTAVHVTGLSLMNSPEFAEDDEGHHRWLRQRTKWLVLGMMNFSLARVCRDHAEILAFDEYRAAAARVVSDLDLIEFKAEETRGK
jgi:hypothetical protein